MAKISEIPDFVGKKLLLRAQKKGIELAGNPNIRQAADVTLLGLAHIMVTELGVEDGPEDLGKLSDLPKEVQLGESTRPGGVKFWPFGRR